MTKPDKTSRATGAYSVNGSKPNIVQSRDKHKLLDDLFYITERQIADLKSKADLGSEFDHKDMQKLDSCLGGMKKLIELESALKSDHIAKMTNEDLVKLARKAIRERKVPDDQASQATGS
tara:strand:- start:1171 stop:1530 length:360 start_codon:yes stop_codon:yes gene_type:complete